MKKMLIYGMFSLVFGPVLGLALLDSKGTLFGLEVNNILLCGISFVAIIIGMLLSFLSKNVNCFLVVILGHMVYLFVLIVFILLNGVYYQWVPDGIDSGYSNAGMLSAILHSLKAAIMIPVWWTLGKGLSEHYKSRFF